MITAAEAGFHGDDAGMMLAGYWLFKRHQERKAARGRKIKYVRYWLIPDFFMHLFKCFLVPGDGRCFSDQNFRKNDNYSFQIRNYKHFKLHVATIAKVAKNVNLNTFYVPQ